MTYVDNQPQTSLVKFCLFPDTNILSGLQYIYTPAVPLYLVPGKQEALLLANPELKRRRDSESQLQSLVARIQCGDWAPVISSLLVDRFEEVGSESREEDLPRSIYRETLFLKMAIFRRVNLGVCMYLWCECACVEQIIMPTFSCHLSLSSPISCLQTSLIVTTSSSCSICPRN